MFQVTATYPALSLGAGSVSVSGPLGDLTGRSTKEDGAVGLSAGGSSRRRLPPQNSKRAADQL